MNNENTRKKFLEQELPLTAEEQSLIQQDMQSADYNFYRSDTTDFRIPSGYEADSTYAYIMQKIRKRPSIGIRYWSIAASIAILVASFTWIQFGRNEIIRIETGYGETRSVSLSDGSEIKLNALSQLEYPKRFKGKERTLTLVGEARFEVVKSPDKPFKVNTELLQVEVLGTVFNLKAYPEESQAETALQEGSVRLNYPNGKSEILQPGQTAIWQKNTVTSQIIEKEFPEWTQGVLKFENAALETIIQTLARQYQSRFEIEDDKKQLRITGSFHTSQSLDEIMEILKEAGNFSYRKEGGTIRIK